jgi:hypothetical protein
MGITPLALMFTVMERPDQHLIQQAQIPGLTLPLQHPGITVAEVTPGQQPKQEAIRIGKKKNQPAAYKLRVDNYCTQCYTFLHN